MAGSKGGAYLRVERPVTDPSVPILAIARQLGSELLAMGDVAGMHETSFGEIGDDGSPALLTVPRLRPVQATGAEVLSEARLSVVLFERSIHSTNAGSHHLSTRARQLGQIRTPVYATADVQVAKIWSQQKGATLVAQLKQAEVDAGYGPERPLRLRCSTIAAYGMSSEGYVIGLAPDPADPALSVLHTQASITLDRYEQHAARNERVQSGPADIRIPLAVISPEVTEIRRTRFINALCEQMRPTVLSVGAYAVATMNPLA